MLNKFIFSVCCFAAIALMAQDTFKVTSGAELKLTGGVIITTENMHRENDGSIFLAAGDGNFSFPGNIPGGNIPLFDALEISKPSVTKLNMQDNISVVSCINFATLLLNLSENNIFIHPIALLNRESETSLTTRKNGGVIEITRPVAENTNIIFSSKSFKGGSGVASTDFNAAYNHIYVRLQVSVTTIKDALNRTEINPTLNVDYYIYPAEGEEIRSLRDQAILYLTADLAKIFPCI